MHTFTMSSCHHDMENCTAVQLRASLDQQTVLLIDCQSQLDYERTHITSAIRVNLPTIVLRRLQKGTIHIPDAIKHCSVRDRFLQEYKIKTVVLYERASKVSALTKSLYNLLVKDGCCVKVLKDFEKFHELFPTYITGCERDHSCERDQMIGMKSLNLKIASPQVTLDSPAISSAPIPYKIIRNLYLGNARAAADGETLARMNIKYVLNVTCNLDNTFESSGEIKYMRIPVQDHWSQNLAAHFEEAIKFIDHARSEGSAVLIHCLAGISRSCTVTVAYLMHHRRMPLNQAYDHVKRVKSDISPNFNFMGQLLEFEKSLKLTATCKCTSGGCTCYLASAPNAFFQSPLPMKSPSPLECC